MQYALEGSQALARTVALCRPQVIAAYPITPQTHIVENLSKLVADGVLDCELVSVESEFSAASVVLGAVAAGARAYTASSSQGILLMSEVLFNIAGAPCHIGVVLERWRFLHAMRGRNSCVEDLDAIQWARRIEGFYRWK